MLNIKAHNMSMVLKSQWHRQTNNGHSIYNPYVLVIIQLEINSKMAASIHTNHRYYIHKTNILHEKKFGISKNELNFNYENLYKQVKMYHYNPYRICDSC